MSRTGFVAQPKVTTGVKDRFCYTAQGHNCVKEGSGFVTKPKVTAGVKGELYTSQGQN